MLLLVNRPVRLLGVGVQSTLLTNSKTYSFTYRQQESLLVVWRQRDPPDTKLPSIVLPESANGLLLCTETAFNLSIFACLFFSKFSCCNLSKCTLRHQTPRPTALVHQGRASYKHNYLYSTWGATMKPRLERGLALVVKGAIEMVTMQPCQSVLQCSPVTNLASCHLSHLHLQRIHAFNACWVHLIQAEATGVRFQCIIELLQLI